jgi:NAD(P)-dependent dehydrogenase (short-subunit alcohol dehydrogenase family)
MERTYVVTGAVSGIGAAVAKYLRERGERIIACDLHDADVIGDLATSEGRVALVDGVMRLSGAGIDGIIANAGGGPPETSVSLNFFGAVATPDGLRPLLASSCAPRAVAVSSVAAVRPPQEDLVAACLGMEEARAVAIAKRVMSVGRDALGNLLPDSEEAALCIYGSAKCALQRWCRSVAMKPQWAGVGIPLNVVALGCYDTPAAAYILSKPDNRAAMARMVPLRGAFPGRPEEAAAVLAWCVSPENSQMTGQVLFADGGLECLAHRESLAQEGAFERGLSWKYPSNAQT